MKGQHKVIVRVEIDGGATIASTEKEFSGGNPSFHASEFAKAVNGPVGDLKKALEGVFGIAPYDRDKRERDRTVVQAALDEVRAKASAYRIVLLKDMCYYYSEALNRSQFMDQWEKVKDDPTLHKLEYGVPIAGERFNYMWHTM